MAVNDIAKRLEQVRLQISSAAESVGRSPADVELVAVSKKHSVQSIEAAYAAGQRVFGESYVDELEKKVAQTAHLADIEFRFIGHLQRNKAQRAVRACSHIDSVHSEKLARALSRHAESAGRTLRVLAQVNVLLEPSKSGVSPDELEPLVHTIRELPALTLDGLMVIPPPDLSRARRAFEKLLELGRHHGLAVLSMGMSADLTLAIECGSTQVRVGSAIFGPRV